MRGAVVPAAAAGGALAPRPPRTVTLALTERRVPVRFVDAAEVIEEIRRCVHGWTIRPAGRVAAPPVSVRGLRGGYKVESIWLDAPITGLTSVAAACCVLIDVLECVVDADPSLLCLHCGAVEIAGRLVVMAGPSRVGKSTLTGRLSSERLTVFCDDMLPIDREGRGVAVGLGPRLRLPLPEAAAPAFRAHVARHLGPADDRYGFVNAPTVARFGRRAPVGAIVLLERVAAGPARFRSVAPAEALAALVRQNIVADRLPEMVLDRFERLVAGAPCVALDFADVEEAAELIVGSFAAWPPGDLRPLPARPAAPPSAEPEASPADPALRYRRRGDVAVRRVGEELFLTQAEQRRILRLNQVGGAVWTLLADPATPRQLARDLGVVFPDTPPATIEADVLRLVGAMLAHDLAEAAPGARTEAARGSESRSGGA